MTDAEKAAIVTAAKRAADAAPALTEHQRAQLRLVLAGRTHKAVQAA